MNTRLGRNTKRWNYFNDSLLFAAFLSSGLEKMTQFVSWVSLKLTSGCYCGESYGDQLQLTSVKREITVNWGDNKVEELLPTAEDQINQHCLRNGERCQRRRRHTDPTDTISLRTIKLSVYMSSSFFIFKRYYPPSPIHSGSRGTC